MNKKQILAHGTTFLPKLKNEISSDDLPLNAKTIAKVAWNMLPGKNQDDEDFANFDKLMWDFDRLGIKTIGELREIIQKNLSTVMESDRANVNGILKGNFLSKEGKYLPRAKEGVYFTHIGLIRCCCQREQRERQKTV